MSLKNWLKGAALAASLATATTLNPDTATANKTPPTDPEPDHTYEHTITQEDPDLPTEIKDLLKQKYDHNTIVASLTVDADQDGDIDLLAYSPIGEKKKYDNPRNAIRPKNASVIYQGLNGNYHIDRPKTEAENPDQINPENIPFKRKEFNGPGHRGQIGFYNLWRDSETNDVYGRLLAFGKDDSNEGQRVKEILYQHKGNGQFDRKTREHGEEFDGTKRTGPLASDRYKAAEESFYKYDEEEQIRIDRNLYQFNKDYGIGGQMSLLELVDRLEIANQE